MPGARSLPRLSICERRLPDFDAWVTPAARGEAPLASSGTGDPVMSRMWTALHLPLLAVPVSVGPRGLPTGVQLVGAEGADGRLLEAGKWTAKALTTQ